MGTTSFEKVKHLAREGLELRGIDEDTLNNWMTLYYAHELESIDLLKPIHHFSEYIQEKYDQTGINEQLEKSDPNVVAEFDRLVDQYNNDLSRIIAEKDFDTALSIYNQAEKLIRSPRT